MIRSALALLILLAALFAHDAHASTRVRTTNVTESAPLNFVARAFSKIQKSLAPAIESDRVSYKILVPDASTAAIRDLLVNVNGGPNEAAVTSLEEASNSASALEHFLNLASLKTDSDDRATHGFESAVKSALVARTDIRLYSADITTRTQTERVLILRDDETRDLLLVSFARLR